MHEYKNHLKNHLSFRAKILLHVLIIISITLSTSYAFKYRILLFKLFFKNKPYLPSKTYVLSLFPKKYQEPHPYYNHKYQPLPLPQYHISLDLGTIIFLHYFHLQRTESHPHFLKETHNMRNEVNCQYYEVNHRWIHHH